MMKTRPVALMRSKQHSAYLLVHHLFRASRIKPGLFVNGGYTRGRVTWLPAMRRRRL
jgi:hypothetical protein